MASVCNGIFGQSARLTQFRSRAQIPVAFATQFRIAEPYVSPSWLVGVQEIIIYILFHFVYTPYKFTNCLGKICPN